ncbi:unnamed protein product [Arabidopsis lyrata]|nr:unnamed protein product [Arabidopsis lyrata]
MRTHSKAFSLREAKGCCATFFSSMGGGSDLGTTSADQDSICGYLSGDYVCRKPRKISQISPPPSLE